MTANETHGIRDGIEPPYDRPGVQAVVSDYTAILSGRTWYGPGSTDHPFILTYSFSTAAQPYLPEVGFSQDFIDSFVPFTEAMKTLARNAVAQWANASGIVAIEVPAGQGDVQLGRFNFNDDSTLQPFDGYAFYPHAAIGQTGASEDGISGDVFINSLSNPTHIDLQLLLHEFGHAMGFKHPFEGDPILDQAHDNTQYTVMSYTGARPGTLAPFDHQAIEHLYGTQAEDGSHVDSWSYNSTTHVLSQTGGGGDETIRGTYGADAIYGGGGNDLLFGSFGDDSLRGGLGDDALFGFDGDDRLLGSRGADRIDGGDGSDILIYTTLGDSHGAKYDTVAGFDALNADRFAVAGTVAAIDDPVHGDLSAASFKHDIKAAVGRQGLQAHDAVLFYADGGDLAGQTFLIVDQAGKHGYHVDADIVLRLEDAVHLDSLDAADFF